MHPEAITRSGFARRFGGAPTVVVAAPGRVNLIGEHTDYTGGLVLPVALPLRVWVAARPRADQRLHMAALDLDEVAEAGPGDPPPAAAAARWSDYTRGVVWALRAAGHPVGGCDLAIHGEVPMGAGLSSSAALGVAVARALAALFAPALAARDLALLAHRAETAFVGLACGVMDQFAAALGASGQALLLDCRSLATEAVALRLAAHGAVLLVLDSGCPRELAASAYNQRVAECGEALAGARRILLAAGAPATAPHTEAAPPVATPPALRAPPDGGRRTLTALRDLTPDDLPALAPALDPVLFRRARHVATENARVSAAVAALKAGDLPALGRLLTASHHSLRDDYAVSTPDLDWLVARAIALPSVYGARLTGAGFGGCVLVLAAAAAVPAVEALLDRYRVERGRVGRVVARLSA